MPAPMITLERLKAVLAYDPDTGEFRWKQRPCPNSRRREGDLAGAVKVINGSRHLYIGVDGGAYQGSRLAWMFFYGEWPLFRLSFANGNSADLSISNLEPMKGLLGERFDHKTPDGRLAYQRAHRAAHPDHYRGKDLQKTFGISLADYQRMFVEQKGVCAICAKPETATRGGKTKWLAVDHDHVTGDVRGLLCSNCNPMLGYAQESVEVLTNAIAYLKLHSLAPCISENVVPIKKVNTDG